MAGVSAKDIPIESRFMTDLWAFRKRFYVPEEPDSFWEKLCDEADDLYNKYPSEYFEKLIIACVMDIDKRFRSDRKAVSENEQSRTASER